ncbi:MAG: bifunctional riboflavin kinase/FAD synthetase [Anaerolineales bacterium]|nr:bifunctional riboflavin kinase/FAD synthetase [Anaerolineales bacterium]
MQHFQSLDDIHLHGAWLTIGSFDGVHKGHQAIIKKLTAGAHASGVPAVVLTFHPHPAVILRNRQGPYYLTSPEERAARLGELGIDAVITHPFTPEFASQSAFEFMRRIKSQLNLQHLLVGYDFALGRNREGDPQALRRIGQELGYSLDIMEPVYNGGQLISSSQIRAALAEGQIEEVNHLLDWTYQVSGEVVHGDGRGRTIGIPTANLKTWPGKLLPCTGVYACLAYLEGRAWQAVSNIGVRPTFENQPLEARLETHLLDFKGDLYHKQITLAFVKRLRDEQRFPDVTTLINQIQQDILQARSALDHFPGT